MVTDKDVERAVRHIISNNHDIQKTDQEILCLSESIKNLIDTRTYKFDNLSIINLNQNGKTRVVRKYENIFSAENVLCHHIKHFLDRIFKIKYPNRNKVIRSIFSYITAVRQMTNFTIIKFDFKDYYNSVSAEYVFEKCIRQNILDRFELELISDFIDKTRYTYAGLCTSNVIAEIIANDFDREIRSKFISKGLLFYERYIDDCILILNENIEQPMVKMFLGEILEKVFRDPNINVHNKCKTKFNERKFQFLSKNTLGGTPYKIDYLGYELAFYKGADDEVKIEYGITLAKQEKYKKRLEKIILSYKDKSSPDYNNMELLRHRILAFSSRVVYISKHFNKDVWKVKGFISNYGELRYLIDTEAISRDTEKFLKNAIRQAFLKNNIGLPYFMKPNGYSLFENMKNNRTILLVDNIGYDYSSLTELCKQIGISHINANKKNRGYGALVREYLIKVKVGY